MRLLTPLALLLILAGCALQPRATDPAAFPWGAAPDAVRGDRPGAPIIATPERHVYHGEFAGLPATLVYHFADDGLAEVVVFNRSRHDDRTRYIDDFERLANDLRARYGQPRLEDMRWRNRLFAGRPERWGDAISAGHLAFLARWDTAEAAILMALRGERYQVVHELVFLPPGEAH